MLSFGETLERADDKDPSGLSFWDNISIRIFDLSVSPALMCLQKSDRHAKPLEGIPLASTIHGQDDLAFERKCDPVEVVNILGRFMAC